MSAPEPPLDDDPGIEVADSSSGRILPSANPLSRVLSVFPDGAIGNRVDAGFIDRDSLHRLRRGESRQFFVTPILGLRTPGTDDEKN